MTSNKNLKKFIIFILLGIAITSEAWGNEFIDRVNAKSEVYQTYSTSEEAAEMALAGQQQTVDLKLLSLVPDDKKTDADYFIVANMLYANNHKLSFELMEKAYALNPDEVMITYEMGMHNHRAGNHKQAIEFYLKAINSEFIPIGHNGYALLADCYLRTGEYEKAMDAWINSDPRDNRIKIEKAIYNIYGDETPLSERSTLITEIKSGEMIKFGRLIELNHHWKSDWWNQKVHESYLEHDLNLAAEVLKDRKQLLDEVKLLNDILAHQVNSTQFLARLEKMKIWGRVNKLPELPALTYYMIKKMTDLELVNVEEIVKAYEAELLQKKADKSIDDYEFKILSFLYASTDESKIQALDLYAWKQRQSQVSAENYFVTQLNKGNLEQTLFIQALKDFKDSVILNNIHLTVNESEEAKTDIYAAIVAAEFPNLEYELSSDKLRAFFLSLAKQINHQSYTDTLTQ